VLKVQSPCCVEQVEQGVLKLVFVLMGIMVSTKIHVFTITGHHEAFVSVFEPLVNRGNDHGWESMIEIVTVLFGAVST
jgi:hypothetical protein